MANITYCTNACLTDRTPWQVLCQFKAKILSLLLILAILFHAAVVCISFEIRAAPHSYASSAINLTQFVTPILFVLELKSQPHLVLRSSCYFW